MLILPINFDIILQMSVQFQPLHVVVLDQYQTERRSLVSAAYFIYLHTSHTSMDHLLFRHFQSQSTNHSPIFFLSYHLPLSHETHTHMHSLSLSLSIYLFISSLFFTISSLTSSSFLMYSYSLLPFFLSLSLSLSFSHTLISLYLNHTQRLSNL